MPRREQINREDVEETEAPRTFLNPFFRSSLSLSLLHCFFSDFCWSPLLIYLSPPNEVRPSEFIPSTNIRAIRQDAHVAASFTTINPFSYLAVNWKGHLRKPQNFPFLPLHNNKLVIWWFRGWFKWGNGIKTRTFSIFSKAFCWFSQISCWCCSTFSNFTEAFVECCSKLMRSLNPIREIRGYLWLFKWKLVLMTRIHD